MLAGEPARSAHDRRSAIGAVRVSHRLGATDREIVAIEDKIAGHEEIKSPVAVIVAKGGSG